MNPLAGVRRALVLGLGRFGGGREAVRFLHRRGVPVRIADRSTGEDLLDSRTALADLKDLDWQLGREDEAVLDDVDLLVVNPAIPDQHPLLQAAVRRGIERTQEVALFLEHYPGRVVAVTGTNGKSTTATILHAALQRSQVDALLGGNIGHSLLGDEARWHEAQTAVLEISSFQLERLDPERHRVTSGVYTRVLKDHLDRHGSLDAYHAAKSRLARMAAAFVVHAADDPVAAGFPTAARRVRYLLEPPPADCLGSVDGWLCARLGDGPLLRLVHESALRLQGDFQRENVLAAAGAALLLGAGCHAAGLAFASATPLPFRLQLVAVLDGVRVYDNGVSTEIESTRSALRNVPGPIRWVGGGKSKDGDFAAVATAIAPLIASAHLFGAAAAPLAQALHGKATATTATALQQALSQALAASRPGDALLFSPAFASFDQYPNFRARALEFHAWLQEAQARSGKDRAGTAQA